MRFNEVVNFGQTLTCLPDQSEIRHIPQFYRASADYAYRLGGPIVRRFIDALPLSKDFKYLSIDSRVHMLMPGWMPCIGGWHCDDFYRPGQPGNVAAGGPVQPALERIKEDGKYSMHHAFVIGETAPTEFIVSPFDMAIPEIKEGDNLYAGFDKRIEQVLEDQPFAECKFCGESWDLFRECSVAGDGLHSIKEKIGLATTRIKSGQIVSFDCFAFHRGTVAKESGWRIFMRATESNHWEPQNEIRTQTQVYLESFHAGW